MTDDDVISVTVGFEGDEGLSKIKTGNALALGKLNY